MRDKGKANPRLILVVGIVTGCYDIFKLQNGSAFPILLANRD